MKSWNTTKYACFEGILVLLEKFWERDISKIIGRPIIGYTLKPALLSGLHN